jgi:hypothetical protein
MQQNRILGTPVQKFDKDLLEQILQWKRTGERLILLMDVNGNPLHNNLYRQIGVRAVGMKEFTHKFWGPTPPHNHSRDRAPIYGGYKSQEIEIVSICMLNFTDSPGDHRSLIFDTSTRSMLGESLNKICRPVSITSHGSSVMSYNKIVQEQCATHQIQERMDAIDSLTRYCGFP